MIYGSVAQAGLRWAVLPILPEVTSQLWSAGSWPGAGWSQMTALIGLAPGPAPGWWAGRLSGSMPTAHPASCRGGGEGSPQGVTNIRKTQGRKFHFLPDTAARMTGSSPASLLGLTLVFTQVVAPPRSAQTPDYGQFAPRPTAPSSAPFPPEPLNCDLCPLPSPSLPYPWSSVACLAGRHHVPGLCHTAHVTFSHQKQHSKILIG